MAKKIKMVNYAEPGVGKSTFAGKFPKPFFICTDGNYSWLDLPEEDHIQVNSWEECKKLFAELSTEKYDKYETIVIDLIEDMFKWCEVEYCKKNKISHMSDLGFGKAYDETRTEFFMEICKVINVEKHIILLTHGYTKTEKDRRGVEINKYWPSDRIPDKVWDRIEGRVRYFLRAYTKGEENEAGRMVKKRYLSLIPKENEFGIARGLDEALVPEDIPLEFTEFANVIGLDSAPVKKETVKITEEKPKRTKKSEEPKKEEIMLEIPETIIENDINEEVISTPNIVVDVIPETEAPFESDNVDINDEAFLLECIKKGMQVVDIETKYGIKFPQDAKIKFIRLKMKNINKIN